ncbi:thiol-disulfide oxidoreductase DCC family protein [Capnocytophaga canis]|uniref:thiol-disulfide oxidoreductase DCC family protein n=1 Tax=Capnocytophaga canis TaxID=1848903 RepID=UPI0038597420
MNNALLIFDGDCLFCNWIAYYLAKSDKNDRFKFVSSTSEIGGCFLVKYELQSIVNKTVIVRVGEVFYIKSKAVFMFLKESNAYPLLRFLIRIVPTCIADFVYDIIARHRKKLIKKACPIPPPEIRKKFLA